MTLFKNKRNTHRTEVCLRVREASWELLTCTRISLGLLAVDWRGLSPVKVLRSNRKLFLEAKCLLSLLLSLLKSNSQEH